MTTESLDCDLLVIGAGAIGFSIGIAMLSANPDCKVVVAEKESHIGLHASGRNSGVLHAGFYYSPESLKAKFCKEGNEELRILARKHQIPIREVGKVVVARDLEEDSRLDGLLKNGIRNGVEVELFGESALSKYEPLAQTSGRFLWSPRTAVSDPKLIMDALKKEFEELGGKVHLNRKVILIERFGEVLDQTKFYSAKFIVNAAGANADRISRNINVGTDYAMLPFMGVYRATKEKNLPLRRLVYPVPHPINPFLGVHFTLTIDGYVKIGPTAIPLLGREQYSFFQGWSSADINQAVKGAYALIRGDKHNFGSILKHEWPKVILNNLVKESMSLVPSANQVATWKKKPPGIRSQLVHLSTGRLEQDFVVRKHLNSVHILNAVSPGWTSAIPFGRWVVQNFLTQ